MNPNDFFLSQLRAIRAEATATIAKVDALIAHMQPHQEQPPRPRVRYLGDNESPPEGKSS